MFDRTFDFRPSPETMQLLAGLQSREMALTKGLGDEITNRKMNIYLK
jgi:hypothetical protein